MSRASCRFKNHPFSWKNEEDMKVLVSICIGHTPVVEAEHQAYTNLFDELSCLLPHMVSYEAKKVDRYIWGLTPQIPGMVTSVEPTILEKAILLPTSLTDEMMRMGTLTKKQAGGKRSHITGHCPNSTNATITIMETAMSVTNARSMDTLRSNADLTQGKQERAKNAEVQTI
ncbi:hypothetical protein E3N88_12098 [Mikania micrantha]|uniref:Uncharacterized protein n=1 Tax=Mikania micrantha TaxID=192012 RepID=A0A5N6P4P1_9ASTR|nr:hypothetical protein E3N88_12098 [Mikania micrantha]